MRDIRMPTLQWNIIKEKILTNGNNDILGHGLNVFPHMTKEEKMDIQP